MVEQQQEIWALVELFGHQRVAGKVSACELGAGNLVRIDIPAFADREALTQYVNVKSIYRVTFVDEATATAMAQSIKTSPVSEWSLKRELERISQKGLGDGSEEEGVEL